MQTAVVRPYWHTTTVLAMMLLIIVVAHVSIPGLHQFPVVNTPNWCLLAMGTVACGQIELWFVGMLS